MSDAVGVVDLGGSHVSAAVMKREILGPVYRRSFPAVGTTDGTLEVVASTMRDAGPTDSWIIATPGPFDYASGRCLITGLGKLDELYNVNLRSELSERLHLISGQQVSFVNDAVAAGLGEWAHGAGQRAARLLYVTIGTGLGTAFLERGVPLDTDRRTPPGGNLGLVHFKDGLVDDYVSSRGLRRKLDRDSHSVTQSAELARSGSLIEMRAFRSMGTDLESSLLPWIYKFGPEVLVLGGGMSHAADLILTGFNVIPTLLTPRQARFPDTAALIGCAWHPGLRQ